MSVASLKRAIEALQREIKAASAKELLEVEEPAMVCIDAVIAQYENIGRF